MWLIIINIQNFGHLSSEIIIILIFEHCNFTMHLYTQTMQTECQYSIDCIWALSWENQFMPYKKQQRHIHAVWSASLLFAT